jgi:UDP-GlcNAc3NAcA epimerase
MASGCGKAPCGAAAQAGSLVTVVGARPQFVKAAALSPALRAAGVRERLVHTGQHYDQAMSQVFFDGLALPAPEVDLAIGSASHGAQTGRMLEAIEAVLEAMRPELVVVFGDTNSTLAGALAAAKLGIAVAHVEAGLRSFDRAMPEEINRVLTDHLAELLFAPTDAAVANLAAEGLVAGVHRSGDLMCDIVERYRPAVAERAEGICRELGVAPRGFAFATVHRAENTDAEERWGGILAAFATLGRELPVVWAAHPRTRARLADAQLPGVRIVPPQPYLDTQALLRSARVVLTDSGGLQKEAALHATPCVVLRERSEWGELLAAGAGTLAGADPRRIVAAARAAVFPATGLPRDLYGDGQSAATIAAVLAARVNGAAPAAEVPA